MRKLSGPGWAALVFCLAVFASSPAEARMLFEGLPKPAAPSLPSAAGSGPAASDFSGGQVVEGFGSSVPLEMAARMIVPPDLLVAFDLGVEKKQPVSWHGGRPWRDALRDMLAPAGLAADEKFGIVSIGAAQRFAAAGPTSVLPGTAAPAAAGSLPVPPAAGQDHAGQDQPADEKKIAVRPLTTWNLKKGGVISRAFYEWAEKAQWQVIWRAEAEYAIAADISISTSGPEIRQTSDGPVEVGEFEQAVEKVVNALREQGVPIAAKFYYENRAVVIRRPGVKTGE